MSTPPEPRVLQARRVVPRDEWRRARIALLELEKEHTRRGDELARMRRELPWVAVEKDYRFDGAEGPKSLGELFRGRSQLIVYQFMFGPDWKEGCPSCSFVADHVDGALVHLEHRDASFTAVSRAPYPKLAAFQGRMGWRFPWVSSHASDFNIDFGVAPSPEQRLRGELDYNFRTGPLMFDELHGINIFAKDASGRIFHTYSAFARGAEPVLGTYAWLDMLPKGRDEDELAFTMAWLRHHDRYGPDYSLDPKSLVNLPPPVDAAHAE
jgi:predicted dithiol-disulfide oxidoreductase (DUF899 family)